MGIEFVSCQVGATNLQTKWFLEFKVFVTQTISDYTCAQPLATLILSWALYNLWQSPVISSLNFFSYVRCCIFAGTFKFCGYLLYRNNNIFSLLWENENSTEQAFNTKVNLTFGWLHWYRFTHLDFAVNCFTVINITCSHSLVPSFLIFVFSSVCSPSLSLQTGLQM